MTNETKIYEDNSRTLYIITHPRAQREIRIVNSATDTKIPLAKPEQLKAKHSSQLRAAGLDTKEYFSVGFTIFPACTKAAIQEAFDSKIPEVDPSTITPRSDNDRFEMMMENEDNDGFLHIDHVNGKRIG